MIHGIKEFQLVNLILGYKILVKKYPPPLHNGKLIKLKYIVQVSTSPPKFNIFINFNDVLKSQYKRFIENKLKINFEMSGLPLKIIYKKSIKSI